MRCTTAIQIDADFKAHDVLLNPPWSPSECVKLWHSQTSEERSRDTSTEMNDTKTHQRRSAEIFSMKLLSVQFVSVAESLGRSTCQRKIYPHLVLGRLCFWLRHILTENEETRHIMYPTCYRAADSKSPSLTRMNPTATTHNTVSDSPQQLTSLK